MKVEDLQAALDEKGIKYHSRAKKAELQKLLAEGVPAAPLQKARPNNDIVISIGVVTADGKEHQCNDIRIHNPRGCIIASKVNDPDFVTGSLKDSLTERFGPNHVR